MQEPSERPVISPYVPALLCFMPAEEPSPAGGCVAALCAGRSTPWSSSPSSGRCCCHNSAWGSLGMSTCCWVVVRGCTPAATAALLLLAARRQLSEKAPDLLSALSELSMDEMRDRYCSVCSSPPTAAAVTPLPVSAGWMRKSSLNQWYANRIEMHKQKRQKLARRMRASWLPR